MQQSQPAPFAPDSTTPASSLVPPRALSSDAHRVLSGGANVRRCLDDLLARGLPADALALVARTLPKRYVVAWACDCLKAALAHDAAATDADRAGLALAQAWLAEPTEDNRRAAMEFAERGEFGSVGAWLAASAGWSGGSLLPKGYDVVAPPDDLPAEAAVAALRLAASRNEDHLGASRGFISRALQIFGGEPRTARVAS